MLGAVVQPECNHDTDSNSKLLQSDESASDIRWSKFAQVQGNDHGQHANRKTRNEATNKYHWNVHSGALNDGADEEDDISHKDRPSTRPSICDWAAEKGTKHTAEGQDRDHPAL